MILIVTGSRAGSGERHCFAKTKNLKVKRQIRFPKTGLLVEGKKSQLLPAETGWECPFQGPTDIDVVTILKSTR